MKTDQKINKLGSRAFPNGGTYILRTDTSYMLFVAHNAGVNGEGPHKHNDALSFEWCVGDRPIIIDPGTGCYTGDLDKKRKYRSTYSHSTVVVDKEEQIPILNSMFALERFCGKVDVVDWYDNDAESLVSAKHTYYSRISEPVIHGRSMVLNKSTHQITIEDVFSCSGSHKFEWYFHLNPTLSAVQTDNKFIISFGSKKIAIISFSNLIAKAAVISGTVSHGYNEESESKILYCEYVSKEDFDDEFVFQLAPV